MTYKIIIIICLLLIVILLNHKYEETFDFYTKCGDCEKKSYHQCRNCSNCGVCINEMGNMYCVKGNQDGPYNRTDCLKWNFGNIYPQYDIDYYKKSLETPDNDARFYPFLKTLDDTKGTQYYTDEYNNKIFTRKNTELKTELSNEFKQRNKRQLQ